MAEPIRSLHIDIEGGWGGSSRSLFELVRRLPDRGFQPTVIHRQKGPIQDWYAGTGIPLRHVPEIPSFVPRETKGFKNLLASSPRFLKLPVCLRIVEDMIRTNRVNLFHFNYEGLFLLAGRLRHLGIPGIMHSRTLIPDTVLGRWMAKSMARAADHIFFISPTEVERFARAIRAPANPAKHEVMFNITRPPYPRRPWGTPPEIVYFGSLDHSKGTDRLIEIAACLNRIQAPPLRIQVHGKARTDSGFQAYLESRIAREGLADRIVLSGYATDPMDKMAGAFALIRPSRDNAPWGRDVIEAVSAGLPVIASGSREYTIKNGVSGLLLDPFDPMKAALYLAELARDGGRWALASETATALGRDRFGGEAQADRFREVCLALIEASSRQGGMKH